MACHQDLSAGISVASRTDLYRERRTLAADRYVCGSQCSALAGERLFRAHDAELIPLRVGQDGPGLGAGLPDVDPARPERKQAVNLLIAVRSAAGEVKMHTVLDRLGIGDRHEAHADGRVLVSPDDDLALTLGKNLPAERLRPEPGKAGQVVGVNDDVVKSDRHADSMRGTLDCIPAGAHSSSRVPAARPSAGLFVVRTMRYLAARHRHRWVVRPDDVGSGGHRGGGDPGGGVAAELFERRQFRKGV